MKREVFMEDRENEYYPGCEYDCDEDNFDIEDDVMLQEMLKNNKDTSLQDFVEEQDKNWLEEHKQRQAEINAYNNQTYIGK